MSDVHTWSTTAASNNSAVPNGWPDTMLVSGVNNSARENMAAIARWHADMNGTLTTAGSANTYTLTPNRTIAAYAAGIEFVLRFNAANSGAATLNVSSLGAKAIRDENGVALAANALNTGSVYRLTYDATNGYFRMVGSPKTLGSSIASPAGYVIYPSGIYVQWGKESFTTAETKTVTFPTAFPTACLAVFAQRDYDTTGLNTMLTSATSTSQFTLRNASAGHTFDCWWLAIGY